MKAISLLSSGLDSVAALSMSLEQMNVVLGLTFDYGQRCAKKEIEMSERICEHYGLEHKVIRLDWLAQITNTSLVSREMDIPQVSVGDLTNKELARSTAADVWVPNRNGVMLNIAACFAESYECEYVITGFNAEEAESFPDNSAEFIQATNNCFSYSTANGVRVMAPAAGLDKKGIIKRALALKAPLNLSWSCYYGDETPCEHCESCVRRSNAFEQLGLEDPLLEESK